MQLMCLGSKASDVASVRPDPAQQLDLRLPSFEHGTALAAARRRQAQAGAGGAGGRFSPPSSNTTQYTFGEYEVMRSPGLYPGPDQALQLLYRFACARERGLVCVSWSAHCIAAQMMVACVA
jgi:hypothetical protein